MSLITEEDKGSVEALAFIERYGERWKRISSTNMYYLESTEPEQHLIVINRRKKASIAFYPDMSKELQNYKWKSEHKEITPTARVDCSTVSTSWFKLIDKMVKTYYKLEGVRK